MRLPAGAPHGDALDAVRSEDFGRRAEETQVDTAAAAPVRGLRQRSQGLEVQPDAFVLRQRGIVDAAAPVVHDDVRVGQLRQLEQLGRGELDVGGAAADQDVHVAHRAAGQGGEHARGDIGVPQLVCGPSQHTGHVQGHVARPDDDNLFRVEREVCPGGVRMAVVPAHEVTSAHHAGQGRARDVQPAVALGARRVDDGVVAGRQLVVGEVPADLDVADEADLVLGERLGQHTGDGFHRRVIRRNAIAHEAVRGRQPVDDVDVQRLAGGQQRGDRVQAGRPGADDGDARFVHRGLSAVELVRGDELGVEADRA